MAAFLYRLGTFSFRRRRLVLACWIIAAGVILGGSVWWTGPATDGLQVPGTEAQRTLDILEREFPSATTGNATAQLLVVATEGATLAESPGQDAVAGLIQRLGAVPQMWNVTTQAEMPVTPDGRLGTIGILFVAPPDELTVAARGALTSAITESRAAGLTVEAYGDALDSEPELGTAEISALALLLGLALGLGYVLFITSRYRSELARGRQGADAAGRAVATAGSAVVVAGLFVIIPLVGLTAVRVPVLTWTGLGAAGVVAVAVLISLTLLPAVLGFAGHRIPVRPARHGDTAQAGGRPAAARRWVMLVLRRPMAALVIGVAALGIAAVPALGLRLGLPDYGTAPVDSTQRKAYDLISAHLGAGYNGPLMVVVEGADGTEVYTTVTDLPGVSVAYQPLTSDSGAVSLVQVIPRTGPNDPATADLVRAIREATSDLPGRVSVTGRTALNIDTSEQIGDYLLPYLGFIAALAFPLLMMVFRSVLVPVAATLGFLLTIGATFGAMVAVFQWGWLNGLLGVPASGPIANLLPILIAGIAFGIAMSYQVFLVLRMRAEYVARQDPRSAIIEGFSAGARTVTAAAIIMVGIFAGFVFAPDVHIKMLGLGLAVAVLADTFLVRMTIVPALLAMLGRSAWWLPDGLDRALPDPDLEGDRLITPIREEVVAA